MAVYNSSHNADLDDTDLTMINPSLLYDSNDEQMRTFIPIVRRQQQLNHRSDQFNPGADYIVIDHDQQEVAQKIEEILVYYRRELQQEQKTQVDCHRQFLTRLIDLIRPAYSSNQKKMKDLEDLFEQITLINEKRQAEQKNKNEELHREQCRLQQLLIITSNEYQNAERINAKRNYDDWMEIDHQMTKLHDLVEAQRSRIRELTELLFEKDRSPRPLPVSTNTMTANDTPPVNKGRSIVSIVNDDVNLAHQNLYLADSDLQHTNLHPSIRTCPICQGIFNATTMSEGQFITHVNFHIEN